MDFVQLARTLFPTMPDGFIQAFADTYPTWASSPDAVNLTLAELRTHDDYDLWFPGNRRDDGTARLTEAAYLENMAAFRSEIATLGLDPEVFADRYVELIAGDVAPDEFGARTRTLSTEILARSDGLKEYYASEFGLVPSDESILESAFTGTIDSLIRGVQTAQVGFEGERRGFDVGLTLASSLFDAGVRDQGAASQLFGEAASNVPLFGRLVERHFDVDDEFDLGDFIAASVFEDQEQLARQRRLVSQERSLFSDFRTLRERQTGFTGLVPQ